MIFSAQIRAARALLGMSQTDLAKTASVGIATIRRLESGGDQVRGAAETLWKIEKAMQDAGIIFIPPDEQAGPGVRLRTWRDDQET
jgi:transcriptional regulator with XRE-family HTH domain